MSRVLASRRMWVTLSLGFSGGLPLALTAATLQAWMASEKVDLRVIGVFSLVGMPYVFKFLWAPLLDRYAPPGPLERLGRRRGWLLASQLGVIGAVLAMAFCDPVTGPARIAVAALALAFFSATQDTLIDAYRTELLAPEEYGLGNGLYVTGYRVAMLVSGAGALILSDHMSWKAVFLVMGAVGALGPATVLFAREPARAAAARSTLAQSFLEPFTSFFSRGRAFEILAFMVLYKIDYMLTVAMTTPFLLETGFSRTNIGAVTKGFGMVATIAGALAGGAWMLKLGIRRALWVFGIAQAAAGLSYMALARLGHHYPMMVTAITVDNFCSGLAIPAFQAFMMSLCDKRFTATQYALLAGFMALARYISAAPSGFLATGVGWERYYLICALAGIPGLLLLTRFRKWTSAAGTRPPERCGPARG